MIINKRLLLGSLIVVFSGAVLATNCPSVGGYTLSSHSANNERCVYKSNATVKLVLRGQRVQPPVCPRFILTDPHFQLTNCSHSLRLNKCVCTIVSH
ncbi:MAG: hypothetical protein Q8M03_13535 [Legionella sp.]|nr:hypothetical protein [Legionella sp.]